MPRIPAISGAPLLAAVLLLASACICVAHDSHNPLECIGAVTVSGAHHEPGIDMRLNSTELTAPGQWFEVSWEGVEQPSYADWIGLWVPAHANVTATAPAKFKIAASSPTHIMHGRGSLTCALFGFLLFGGWGVGSDHMRRRCMHL